MTVHFIGAGRVGRALTPAVSCAQSHLYDPARVRGCGALLRLGRT
ncbi:hypothetical protein ABZ552_08380 [Nocardia sp. NPDC019219]|nr:hypothetical protein [Nocardia sputorum]